MSKTMNKNWRFCTENSFDGTTCSVPAEGAPGYIWYKSRVTAAVSVNTDDGTLQLVYDLSANAGVTPPVMFFMKHYSGDYRKIFTCNDLANTCNAPMPISVRHHQLYIGGLDCATDLQDGGVYYMKYVD
jgi:hypothetical protein